MRKMFKVLVDRCEPSRGTKLSAGVDLYSRIDMVIKAGETAIVPLGVCLDIKNAPIEIQNNLHKYYVQLEPRSSLRAKGLNANTGIIDIDYPEEIKIIIQNPLQTMDRAMDAINSYITSETVVNLDNDFHIKAGDKIAQVILKEHCSDCFGVSTDEERTSGFGSTGN